MAEVYTVGVHWKARTETVEEVAHRSEGMLNDLYKTHPMFEHWRKPSDNESEARLPFCHWPIDSNELAGIVKAGRYIEWAGNKQLERGFRVQAWDDLGNSKIATLFIMAGDGYLDGPIYLNTAQVSFSSDRTIAERDRFNALMLALRSLILEWQPDRGYAYSYQFGARSRGPGDPFPYLTGCWGAYVKSADIAGVTLPRGAVTDVIEGHGTIVLATREPFNFEASEQVRVAHDIQNTLEPIWQVGRNG